MELDGQPQPVLNNSRLRLALSLVCTLIVLVYIVVPPWVPLEASLQWGAFRRTLALLRNRANRVFVLVGPFNEHMLGDASRKTYVERKRAVEAWRREEGVPCFVPQPLESEHFADASHPLAVGYAALAKQLWEQEDFIRFDRGAGVDEGEPR